MSTVVDIGVELEAWLSLVRARHCKRAFEDRAVPRSIVDAVLEAAAQAPSSRNMQPWAVEVLVGAARDRLSQRLLALHDAGAPVGADFQNHPSQVSGAFAERAAAVGAATLAARGIERHDDAARREHVRDNLRFYGAPLELIFHLPGQWPEGGFLALGCFLQNVMLGLVAAGLGSCPQYSVAGYADAIREELGLGEDRRIVCGLAVGYPDEAAQINALVPERAPLGDYCRWHEEAPP